MNSVFISGRLTRDPEVRYTESQMAIAKFTVAVDRGKGRDGQDKGADFPTVKVFGKQAENCQRFLGKGLRVLVEGRLETGSYDRSGEKVFFTEVIANRVEFIDFAQKSSQNANQSVTGAYNNQGNNQYGFQPVSDADIPFNHRG